MQGESSEEESANQYPISSFEGAGPLAFEWGIRWLKGHEYMHILRNVNYYCERFGFEKYARKSHPMQIYDNPVSNLIQHIDGIMYFVEGKGVGSDFGFPRVASKKKYRWKKMNFTTNLPKKHPQVTYVVASAMRAHPIDDSDDAEYRMHAVIPFKADAETSTYSSYILCHVRKVDHKKEQSRSLLASCFVGDRVDFYRLFSYLHNLQAFK